MGISRPMLHRQQYNRQKLKFKKMKKTLLFLIAATAMMMAGCSNDDFGGATQGMTLNATVEQPASRAIMTEETDGNYQFSFTDNDNISVGNTTLTSDYYIFTKSGEKFSCATAKSAGSDVDWSYEVTKRV